MIGDFKQSRSRYKRLAIQCNSELYLKCSLFLEEYLSPEGKGNVAWKIWKKYVVGKNSYKDKLAVFFFPDVITEDGVLNFHR